MVAQGSLSSPGPASVPLVLLADDDPDTRELFNVVLTREGFGVESAEDGCVAWDKARALLPSVLVTDIVLPRIDGFALCRQLKRHPLTARIPVIAISGYTRSGYLDEARQAGFDAFLLKPVAPDVLVAQIRNTLANTRRVVTASRQLVARSVALRNEVHATIEKAASLMDAARSLLKTPPDEK